MQRFSYGRCVAIILLIGAVTFSTPLMAQAPNVRVQKVLMKFVEREGHSVMGVGSWISGKRFNAATSDFDMRLVTPKGGSSGQQLQQWKQARSRLTKLIKQEFGSSADDILARTNLYAPNQLMHGVEDTADAIDRFRKLNTVPNLSHNGPVTAATPAKYAEGLYGPGSQTYVQGYEKAAGRLFYNNNGKCVTGLSELAHLGEGAPKYTAAGTATTAGQWAMHGMDELAGGRAEKVAKYLARMERDIVKSRSLSRLPADNAFRTDLRQMRELLKKNPGKLADVSDDVTRLLMRGKAESAVLAGFENAGPVRRAYMRVMLDGVAAKNQVGKLLDRVMRATPDWVNAQNAMNFITFAVGTQATAQAAGGGDVMETLGTACEHLKWIKGFGPLLMAELTAEIIKETRAGGYDLIAGYQEAWDLMAGIHTVKGREIGFGDKRHQYTLPDLVANFTSETKLKALVYLQCVNASSPDSESATGDPKAVEPLFARCWPVIRDAWRWERDALTSEYLVIASEVTHAPLLIYYTPKNPKPGETVICEVASYDGRVHERIRRMNEIIRTLYGRGSLVALHHYWTPGGQSAGTLSFKRAFTFDEPGTYPVKVKMEVSPISPARHTNHRVMLERNVEALVDIVVGGEATGGDEEPAICPQCGKPLGTNPNCFNCILHARDLDPTDLDHKGEDGSRRTPLPGE
jgi:hypothetical protein